MSVYNNILITGGSGFIGTRLVRRLTSGGEHGLQILDKKPSLAYPGLVVIGDVRSLTDLRASARPQCTIVHLAAEHRDDVQPKSLYDEVNVGGAQNVVTVAREKGVRKIIFTSSVAVYGFAPIGTGESGAANPFNDYGRTKYEAEQVFKSWQAEAPSDRTLVIVRPTAVFGEQNRGNVYNLLRQIASGKFVMIGNGNNRKSIAYVENVAAFIQHSLSLPPGVHIYNYVDKPDFSMNALVGSVRRVLGRRESVNVRLPFVLGLIIGKGFDLLAATSGRRFSISSIRVKKFCANSVYDTSLCQTGFLPPVPLEQALAQTIRHEFVERHGGDALFFTE